MSEKTGQTPTSLGQTLGKADFAQRPMSLRKFLEPFDHSSLTDAEAGEKYASYKASFAKQQLEDFFEKHKNLAWFREKYHPDVRPDPGVNLKLCERRLEIFMDLYEQGALNQVAPLHSGNEAAIAKFLDTVAVKLAGGTEEDVKFLDEFKYVDTARKAVGNASSVHQRDSGQPDSREVENGQATMAENDNSNTKRSKITKRKSVRPKPRSASARQSRSKQKKQKSNRKGSREQMHSTTASEQKPEDRSGSSDRSRSASASGSSSNSQSSSSSSDEDSSSSSGSNSRSASSGSSSSSASGSSSRSSSSASSRSGVEAAAVANTNALGSDHLARGIKGRGRRKRRTSVTDDRVSSGGSTSRGSSVGVDSSHTDSPHASSRRPATAGEADPDMKEQPAAHADSIVHPTNGSTQPEDLSMDPAKRTADPPLVHRRPVHHTSVLYFPHIPLNVYQKDLIALLSTSPHFIRLAVLDPCIMPASDKLGQPNEPFFDPDSESAPLAIALRRVGWASYAAQALDENGTLIEIDLDAIRTRLIQQASEAQAPNELLDCLRLSRSLPDPMRRLPTDRVRSTGSILTSLLKLCPSRVYSKGVLRRHLVLAARLTDELDKARGLWSPTKADGAHDEATAVGAKSAQSTELMDSVETRDQASPREEPQSKDEPEGEEELPEEENAEEQSTDPLHRQANDDAASLSPGQTTPPVTMDNTIDPGEDLVSAANLLSTVVSKNPLLTGLTDYLVDEGNAEEELLLSGGFQAMSFMHGIAPPVTVGSAIPSADNTEMLQVLDRLILYLRIVHSVDFYAPALYVNEDAMPHPCQLLHVRPSKAQLQKALGRFIPQGTEKPEDTSRQETLFSNQLKRLIRLVRPLSATDCVKLGLRDVEEVVEAFVKANTRRKKRKTDVIWVCPLSDKKFRDPIYVKKHIMNKHMDKVEAVKKDTAFFFNNYLLDPMRPQLPLEPHLPNKRKRSRSRAGSRQRESVSTNEPTVTGRNHIRSGPNRERSNTDQSTQRWYTDRRMRDENDSRSFYPSNPFGRDYGPPGAMGPPRPYGRMPYFQPRLPFHTQRGRYFGSGSNYQGMRHGFQRRPYVDLDAP